MGQLDGKVAIITGGARGQGEAEARLFHAEGASVVIADVLDEPGQEVAASLGERAVYVHLDVSDQEQWAAAVAVAVERFGGVDTLINNAAVFWTRPLMEETVESLDKLWSINLRGPFLGIQAVHAQMQARGGGSVVNIASTASLTGYPTMVAYSTAKWGLRGLTRVAAAELAVDKIRVNCIAPGGVATAMSKMAGMDTDDENYKPGNLMARIADPSEIASIAVFLSSEASSFMTGSDVVADGGGLLA
jgi:3alpha(or 20beta)-hydroxysteroid dehydrogenase